ncbi:hypothetical protein BJV78DRAFT_494980 [Lactifluus subvellereus]|nr:hypothetical protein BJV78DRAFT_494980 [Lactifluus subvellereus]
MSSPPSTRPPLTWPSPESPPLPPPDSSPHDSSYYGGLSLATIGYIIGFHALFAVFLALSTALSRCLSARARASPSTRPAPGPRRRKRRRRTEQHRPKLWEVELDEDRDHESSVAMRDWKPVAAWTDDGLTPPSKTSELATPVTALTGIDRQVAMAQPWCYGSYPFLSDHLIQSSAHRPPPCNPVSGPRTLNVAVLVAMPSQRPEAHRVRGTTSRRHAVGPRLSYGEGQLLMGVTSLPCEERVVLTAPGGCNHDRTT